MKRRSMLPRRLCAERLEDRDVPATFGVAWPDPQHLTVSFAPDRASASGASSGLFHTLRDVASTAVWQTEILRALQTWAVQADINIGLVDDHGLANVAADITANGDVDFYKYTLPAHSDKDVTVRVQTKGVSLLTPKLTVYDAAGNVVGTGTSTDPLDDGVSVTLRHTGPGVTYYLKV